MLPNYTIHKTVQCYEIYKPMLNNNRLFESLPTKFRTGKPNNDVYLHLISTNVHILLIYTVNIVFDAFLHDLYMLVDVFKQHNSHVTIIFNYIYEPTCITCKL
jgi:hypothetical protein